MQIFKICTALYGVYMIVLHKIPGNQSIKKKKILSNDLITLFFHVKYKYINHHKKSIHQNAIIGFLLIFKEFNDLLTSKFVEIFPRVTLKNISE